MASIRIVFACAQTKRLGIARFEQFDNDPHHAWWLTAARPLGDDAQANQFTSIGNIKGPFYYHHDYAGCPHCDAKSFVKCHNCGRMSCWNNTRMGPCGWCPATGAVEGSIQDLARVD